MTTDENHQEMEEDLEYEEARQLEYEIRYPSPLPKRGDVIFVKDQDPDRKFLQEGLGSPYTDSYRFAADILLRHVKQERTTDSTALDMAHWLVYPIYFCFRQSIELRLKRLLALQKADGSLPADKADLLDNKHDLRELWEPSEPWAMNKRPLVAPEATESFKNLLDQIHAEDEKGDAGRYEMRWVGTGKNRKLQPSFPSYAPLLLEAVEDAGVKMLNYIQRIFTSIEDEEQERAAPSPKRI